MVALEMAAASAAMPGTGALIYDACKPLIKLILTTLTGLGLAKNGLLPSAGIKGISQVILNITLPSLLFSKIVPAFTPQNVSAIGPLVLVALIYESLGLLFGLLVRAIFPLPRTFRNGVLVAAIWSNWGDLPTSVIMTLTASQPFNSATDSSIAIAYVSIFILVFYITLFPLGGVHLIAMDYTQANLAKRDREEDAGGWGKVSWTERSGVARFKTWWRTLPASMEFRRWRCQNEGNAQADQEKVLAALPARLSMKHRTAHTDSVKEERPSSYNLQSPSVSATPTLHSPSSGSPQPAPVYIAPTVSGAMPTLGQAGLELRPMTSNRSGRSIASLSVKEAAGAAAAAPIRRTRTGSSSRQRRRRSSGYSGASGLSRLAWKQELVEENGAVSRKDKERLAVIASARPSPEVSVEDVGAVGAGTSLAVGESAVADSEEDDDASSEAGSSRRQPTSFTSQQAARVHPGDHDPAVGRTFRLRQMLYKFVLSLLTPPTISLVLALIIALVSPLKALFVLPTDPHASFNPTAPDNQPPLSVLLDTATFLGAASVPLGLIVLGASLSRLHIPRPISRLPLLSIVSLALAKMVVLPVLGVLMVDAMTRSGIIAEGNKVLRFVCIFFSCVPTATTQVYINQLVVPEGEEKATETLGAYLIVQYAVAIFAIPILTAYTLSILF